MSRRPSPVAWLPPLAARLAMGARFIAAGVGKASFYFLHYDSLTAAAANLGLSPSVVRFAVLPMSAIEVSGGLALLLGAYTRAAASVVLAVLATYAGLEMVQAGGLLRRDVAFDMSVYAILLVWLATDGGGAVSVDARLAEGSPHRWSPFNPLDGR